MSVISQLKKWFCNLLILGIVTQIAAATTMVLTDPDDPYYSIAQEIAREEDVPLVTSLEEALAAKPSFLLWVVAPGTLSDARIIAFSRAIQADTNGVAVGVITGSTPAAAAALWQRGRAPGGPRLFAVIGADRESHVANAMITETIDTESNSQPASISTLQAALQSAGYLSYGGHGGVSFWGLDQGPNLTLRPDNIPPLPPVVISTGSCETMQIWRNNAIALAFIDQGAAAYSGFVYSPNSGFLMGALGDLPYRYTWPDFPIGYVVRVQGEAALRGYARLNYHYLLGDPRIALSEKPPYSIIEDRQQNRTRTLVYTNAPAGVIPVRIEDGALYSFVEVVGQSSAWARDPFYNGKVQFTDVGPDKYLLFLHEGGDFTIRLQEAAPILYRLTMPVIAAFDRVYLFNYDTGGQELLLMIDGIMLIVAGILFRRRKNQLRAWLIALTLGILFALLHTAYGVLRLPYTTITNKPLILSPLGPVSTFIQVSTGAFIFYTARSWSGRIAGIAVATLTTLFMTAMGFVLIFLINTSYTTTIGAPLWNHASNVMGLLAWIITAILLWTAYYSARRWLVADDESGESKGI